MLIEIKRDHVMASLLDLAIKAVAMILIVAHDQIYVRPLICHFALIDMRKR